MRRLGVSVTQHFVSSVKTLSATTMIWLNLDKSATSERGETCGPFLLARNTERGTLPAATLPWASTAVEVFDIKDYPEAMYQEFFR